MELTICKLSGCMREVSPLTDWQLTFDLLYPLRPWGRIESHSSQEALIKSSLDFRGLLCRPLSGRIQIFHRGGGQRRRHPEGLPRLSPPTMPERRPGLWSAWWAPTDGRHQGNGFLANSFRVLRNSNSCESSLLKVYIGCVVEVLGRFWAVVSFKPHCVSRSLLSPPG